MNRGVFLLMIFLVACSSESERTFLGYIEGETLEMASSIAGTLKSLPVHKGEIIKPNTLLFVLEQEKEKAQKREAEKKLLAAKARLENLKKGKRPSEIAIIEAQLQEVKAKLKLAEVEYQRENTLYLKKVGTKSKLDETLARLEQTRAKFSELQAQLRTAHLPARQDEIRSAQAEVSALSAFLDQSKWNLEQKQVVSPTGGQVTETYYLPGEWVGAGTPVLSFLPPEQIKARFFVPESMLGEIKIGQKTSVQCDGCKKNIFAEISFIAPQAEFTPPVIYSRTERSKLVFLVEARPDPNIAPSLHPGQPVEVTLVLENDHE